MLVESHHINRWLVCCLLSIQLIIYAQISNIVAFNKYVRGDRKQTKKKLQIVLSFFKDSCRLIASHAPSNIWRQFHIVLNQQIYLLIFNIATLYLVHFRESSENV